MGKLVEMVSDVNDVSDRDAMMMNSDESMSVLC